MYRTDFAFAQEMDATDPLRSYRDRFHLPLTKKGNPYLYFTGNSLGCQPKTTAKFIQTELEDWQYFGVEGHFHARNPWMPYHEFLTEAMARIVGAKPEEVIVMNALTVNLHLMMVSFYQPSMSRFKIMIEADAFPSDIYAVESQLRFHGYDPKYALIKLYPRKGEHCIRTEDIEAQLEREGEKISLVLLGGVNYYTGQAFEFERIVKAGHAQGCMVGFDCAHAAGNLALHLHDWGVDFAVWCSYKYLNAGPGAVGGCFIHENHLSNAQLNRFAGWWGHDKGSRFTMPDEFVPIPTAEGWQLSNAPILSMAALRASLEIFEEVGMETLRKKSEKLTGYLEFLLDDIQDEVPLEVITPRDPKQRGCQLSFLTQSNGKKLFNYISERGVITDWREPNVIRMSPVPLYNRFEDVWRFVQILRAAAENV